MKAKTTLIVIGIVFIVLGLLAASYVTTTEQNYLGGLFTDQDLDKPYEGYSIPLIIGGVILILVGAFMSDRREVK